MKQPSRTEVRRVICIECGADTGEQCMGTRGRRRESNHLARVRTYEKMLRPR